jgi:hypothetical protein
MAALLIHCLPALALSMYPPTQSLHQHLQMIVLVVLVLVLVLVLMLMLMLMLLWPRKELIAMSLQTAAWLPCPPL